ncbi:MAG: glycosyltransferase [Actinomycetota bacterium]|nr:glycosyltransferase [Actinomycetota bacterium]
MNNPMKLLGRLSDRLIAGPAAQFAADVREALDDEPADAVLVSGALLGAMVGAESRCVPLAVLNANIYPLPAPGLPPFGTALKQARGRLGRVRDRVLGAVTTRVWARGLPALNAARAELGLAPLKFLWQQWDRAERVLMLTSAEFDYTADRLPNNVVYVGAILDDPADAGEHELPAGNEPLVVVGMSSTYQQQTDALRRIVEALAALPVRAVVTTGHAVDPSQVPGRGKVQVVRSAPHSQLFPHAAVVITHAGHGTLIKALAAGVPAVCMPFGRDQGDNVTRAARHGVAIGLKRTASPAQIAAAVQKVLSEPSYRQAAQRLGPIIRRDAASTVLVDELEALARNGAATTA